MWSRRPILISLFVLLSTICAIGANQQRFDGDEDEGLRIVGASTNGDQQGPQTQNKLPPAVIDGGDDGGLSLQYSQISMSHDDEPLAIAIQPENIVRTTTGPIPLRQAQSSGQKARLAEPSRIIVDSSASAKEHPVKRSVRSPLAPVEYDVINSDFDDSVKLAFNVDSRSSREHQTVTETSTEGESLKEEEKKVVVPSRVLALQLDSRPVEEAKEEAEEEIPLSLVPSLESALNNRQEQPKEPGVMSSLERQVEAFFRNIPQLSTVVTPLPSRFKRIRRAGFTKRVIGQVDKGLLGSSSSGERNSTLSPNSFEAGATTPASAAANSSLGFVGKALSDERSLLEGDFDAEPTAGHSPSNPSPASETAASAAPFDPLPSSLNTPQQFTNAPPTVPPTAPPPPPQPPPTQPPNFVPHFDGGFLDQQQQQFPENSGGSFSEVAFSPDELQQEEVRVLPRLLPYSALNPGVSLPPGFDPFSTSTVNATTPSTTELSTTSPSSPQTNSTLVVTTTTRNITLPKPTKKPVSAKRINGFSPKPSGHKGLHPPPRKHRPHTTKKPKTPSLVDPNGGFARKDLPRAGQEERNQANSIIDEVKQLLPKAKVPELGGFETPPPLLNRPSSFPPTAQQTPPFQSQFNNFGFGGQFNAPAQPPPLGQQQQPNFAQPSFVP